MAVSCCCVFAPLCATLFQCNVRGSSQEGSWDYAVLGIEPRTSICNAYVLWYLPLAFFLSSGNHSIRLLKYWLQGFINSRCLVRLTSHTLRNTVCNTSSKKLGTRLVVFKYYCDLTWVKTKIKKQVKMFFYLQTLLLLTWKTK